ncbi:MAG: YbaB/EbfC family nucleoid-associated protein [Clostridiales bacterium]|nr:YbaB/EbfC family nucleoid-associated protein [Clostridiales bacterium]MCD7828299.1 YbaB/EbfC family nucleoid-associated protein [Clostridiales bacterium]
MKARIPNANQGGNMMQKLQKIQEEMAQKQSEVEASEFTASAGGGAVEVTVSGKHEVKSIKMQPEIIDPEDIDMLEDLLLASLNEAMRKADETMENEMNKLSGGLNIPGMGGMF